MKTLEASAWGRTWEMNMESLVSIIDGLWSNDISRFFSIVIIAYFVIAIVLVSAGTKHPRLVPIVEMTPSILSSLGILGTFTGIFIGLFYFDIRTIDKSVPELLEGLKIAFGTSILGLSGALIFRVLRPLIAKASVSENAGVDDIVEELRQLSQNVMTGHQISEEGFDRLNKSLSGDSDSSVTGQLQRIRASLADLEKTSEKGFEKQIEEFQKFADDMAKAFSDTLIEGLRDAIGNLNDVLAEQFGDNLKQLNEAVGRLLEWQEDYRIQMSELKAAFDRSLEGIDASKDALVEIEAASSNIPEHMSKLTEANEMLLSQIGLLHDGLASVWQMREKAEGAIPAITANIDQMTTTISETVSELRKNIETSLNEQKEVQTQMIETLRNANVEFDVAMQEAVQEMAANLSGLTEKLVEDYAPLLEATRNLVVELGSEARS
jgi:gas vesicle protein